MKQNSAIGAITALITPFKNGKINKAEYELQIKRQIRLGISAVVPVGTTGESATLSHDEHRECIEIAIATAKANPPACEDSINKKEQGDCERIRILAGAGSNSTDEAIELAQFAQKAGADAILSVCPYYNKPTQAGLYAHFAAIAKAVEIPIMLYNVPSRTGCTLEVDTILRLFADFPHIYGLKEASGNIEKIVELNSKEPNLAILSGDDSINFPILACGGVGVISVSANLLPNKISELCAAAKTGDYKRAREINNELFEINKALFIESNPIPIKAAMYEAGLLENLEYRLPVVAPSEATMKKIKEILKKYEVKK